MCCQTLRGEEGEKKTRIWSLEIWQVKRKLTHPPLLLVTTDFWLFYCHCQQHLQMKTTSSLLQHSIWNHCTICLCFTQLEKCASSASPSSTSCKETLEKVCRSISPHTPLHSGSMPKSPRWRKLFFYCSNKKQTIKQVEMKTCTPHTGAERQQLITLTGRTGCVWGGRREDLSIHTQWSTNWWYPRCVCVCVCVLTLLVSVNTAAFEHKSCTYLN